MGALRVGARRSAGCGASARMEQPDLSWCWIKVPESLSGEEQKDRPRLSLQSLPRVGRQYLTNAGGYRVFIQHEAFQTLRSGSRGAMLLPVSRMGKIAQLLALLGVTDEH